MLVEHTGTGQGEGLGAPVHRRRPGIGDNAEDSSVACPGAVPGRMPRALSGLKERARPLISVLIV